MSRRLKHCADEIVLRVQHLFSSDLDFPARLAAFRAGLLKLSEDSLEHWRQDLDRLWQMHDHSVEHARRFFDRCQEIYDDIMGAPA